MVPLPQHTLPAHPPKLPPTHSCQRSSVNATHHRQSRTGECQFPLETPSQLPTPQQTLMISSRREPPKSSLSRAVVPSIRPTPHLTPSPHQFALPSSHQRNTSPLPSVISAAFVTISNSGPSHPTQGVPPKLHVSR